MAEEITEQEIDIKQALHRIPADFIPDFTKRPASYSSLKHFNITPVHLLHYLTAPRKESKQMFLGTVLDCLLLTPDDFEALFYFDPVDAPKRPADAQINAKYMKEGTKEYDAGKAKDINDRLEWWSNFEESNKGKRLITADILEIAYRMKESVDNYGPAQELLQRVTETQKTIYFSEKNTGIRCVAKIDMRGEGFIADLKTTASPEPGDYNRSAFDFMYFLQAGVYLKAVEAEYFQPVYKTDFYHLVVESCAPFTCDVRKADDKFKKVGVGEFERLIKELEYCRDNNLWRTGFDFKRFYDKVGRLELPGYAYNLIEKYK